MDAQELLGGDLKHKPPGDHSAAGLGDFVNPLAFCEGCALALGISISCWALFFSIIHFLVVLVTNGR